MLFRKLIPKKHRISGWLVIDLTEEGIRLPSGKFIPLKNILKIDVEKGIIVYRDYNGEIREEPYTPTEKLKQLIQEKNKEEIPIYT